MFRRDFLAIAAAAPLLDAVPLRGTRLAGLLSEIEAAVHEEFPDIRNVQIKLDPGNHKIPLMVLAYR